MGTRPTCSAGATMPDAAVTPADETSSSRPADDGPWYTTTWPLHKPDWWQLLWSLLAVIAVGSVYGRLMYGVFDGDGNPVIRLDEHITNWFVERRTDSRTTIATWSSGIASTTIKIGASIIVVCLVLWLWRRWHEAVWIALTLTFEATAFIVISTIVHRSRPDVEHLQQSPVNTGFPSGHMAAATVYIALAVIVFWHTRSVIARGVAVVLCTVVPIMVGAARLYLGMHFFTDVLGGLVLGIVSLLLCYRVLGPPADAVTETN